jgi:hypothetical protein
MAQNEFLKRREQRDRECFRQGLITGMQIVHDYVTIALRRRKVMGKDIFGRGRIDKLFAEVEQLDDYYSRAFSKHKEADAKQEEIDGELKELYGDQLVKFPERYPYIKQYGYDKPRKGWVE